jgi:hypothetical protein
MTVFSCAAQLYKEALWTVDGVFDQKQPIIRLLQMTFEKAVRLGTAQGASQDHVDALIAIMKTIKTWNGLERRQIEPLHIDGWEPMMMECLRLCAFGHQNIEAEFRAERDRTSRQRQIEDAMRDQPNQNPSCATSSTPLDDNSGRDRCVRTRTELGPDADRIAP